MTLNKTTFSAFRDELVKISFYQTLRNGLVNAAKEGWNGTPEQIANGEGASWFGHGRQIKPGMGNWSRKLEEFTSLGGATKALPVGAKSMMALGTAAMARDAFRPVDPTGMQRSRTERVTGLAGNTIGGLIGSAIGNRIAPGLIGSMSGGIGGGMLGERITSAPFRMLRNRQTAQSQQQLQQPPQPAPFGGASV